MTVINTNVNVRCPEPDRPVDQGTEKSGFPSDSNNHVHGAVAGGCRIPDTWVPKFPPKEPNVPRPEDHCRPHFPRGRCLPPRPKMPKFPPFWNRCRPRLPRGGCFPQPHLPSPKLPINICDIKQLLEQIMKKPNGCGTPEVNAPSWTVPFPPPPICRMPRFRFPRLRLPRRPGARMRPFRPWRSMRPRVWNQIPLHRNLDVRRFMGAAFRR